MSENTGGIELSSYAGSGEQKTFVGSQPADRTTAHPGRDGSPEPETPLEMKRVSTSIPHTWRPHGIACSLGRKSHVGPAVSLWNPSAQSLTEPVPKRVGRCFLGLRTGWGSCLWHAVHRDTAWLMSRDLMLRDV